jgi:hypothetical protein
LVIESIPERRYGLTKKIGIIYITPKTLANLERFAQQFGTVYILKPYDTREDMDLILVHSNYSGLASGVSGSLVSKNLADFVDLYLPFYIKSGIPVLGIGNACLDLWNYLGGKISKNVPGHKTTHSIVDIANKICVTVSSNHSDCLQDNCERSVVLAWETSLSSNKFKTIKPSNYHKYTGHVEIFTTEDESVSGVMSEPHLKENLPTSYTYKKTGLYYGDLITLNLINKLLMAGPSALQ